jgi:RNA polymerase sigma-70 factor (ECF subfamily)
MYTTSATLLERLRQPAAHEAWDRFVDLYSPLLHTLAHRLGLQGGDADDLVQDVLTVLVQQLPEFHYNGTKSFRSWLCKVTVNKWRENGRRRAGRLAGASADALSNLTTPDDIEAFINAEYENCLVRRALQLMKADFNPATCKAVWEHVVRGRSAAEVAAELGLSEGAVYAARHRVIRRLREELSGLLD